MSLWDDLARLLEPSRVLDGPVDLAAHSSDASFFRMVPRAVVRPRSIDEIRSLFAFAAHARVPLTFRAAGTSLSGQAVTDGIVVDVSRHWRELAVEDGGRRVRVGPGVIGGFVNRRLEALGRKLGPDPASIDVCMIGGIVSNNSSGMDAEELRGLDLDGCYATSRTCEIGLSRATGRSWLSIWQLLDDASR